MTGGYWNRVLRVNLGSHTWSIEALPDQATLRKYVGGIGFGMKVLLDELRPGQDATDPDTPLVLATGPLAGTTAPSSSNLAIITLNFNTPYAISTSHTHGYFAAYLRHAGWDAIVVTGRSEQPVVLWIDDDKVEIRNAQGLWGQDTRETERLLKRELGDEHKISVVCIGPAGEAVLPGASVRNDRNHGAHKGSPGAIMGSKRLKAIAVRGTKRVPLHRPEAFFDVTERWSKAIHEPQGEGQPPSMGSIMSKAGITRMYSLMGEHSMTACKNLSDPAWAQDFSKRFVEDVHTKFTVVPKESYNCNIACAYDCTINTGPYQGMTASLCGGAENIDGAAAMVGIEDPAEALVITDYYDSMGMDSSVGGSLISMAFELYNTGALTKEHTGGLDLTWGRLDSAMELLNQMIEGRDFGGRVLARGLKEAARLLGPAAEACVVHIRGGGMNIHDWRGAWSILLGQILSSGAGVAWQGPGVDVFATEPDLGLPAAGTPHVAEGKAQAVYKTQCKKLFEDTLGICWFAAWGLHGSLQHEADAIRHATGWDDFSAQEALLIGERLVVLQRLLALRRGFTPKDEFDVSNRVLEAPATGASTGITLKPHLERMVSDYYKLADWNPTTGAPSAAALARVGLTDISY
jgi:aldehyde:ferredoxin oxidoreductase